MSWEKAARHSVVGGVEEGVRCVKGEDVRGSSTPRLGRLQGCHSDLGWGDYRY